MKKNTATTYSVVVKRELASPLTNLLREAGYEALDFSADEYFDGKAEVWVERVGRFDRRRLVRFLEAVEKL